MQVHPLELALTPLEPVLARPHSHLPGASAHQPYEETYSL